MRKNLPSEFKFDEIGHWSELKLDIIKKYTAAYTKILSKQNFHFVYIDGFAGAGVHVKKHTGESVLGSPLNALNVDSPFKELFLVDLNRGKIDHLKNLIPTRDRPRVHLFNEDCNKVLLEKVFPNVQYDDYRRGLCLLDPYGLHLNWEVIKTAGEMKSLDIFLNFPIMDINRNALWRNPDGVSPEGIERMTAFWGDDSWRKAGYSKERGLFEEIIEKRANQDVVDAFRKRLETEAKFKCVPEPLPMRNSNNAVVYYLFFASQKEVGAKIAREIFTSYKRKQR